MKKRLLKNLALTLAFAMVVPTVPESVTAADAQISYEYTTIDYSVAGKEASGFFSDEQVVDASVSDSGDGESYYTHDSYIEAMSASDSSNLFLIDFDDLTFKVRENITDASVERIFRNVLNVDNGAVFGTNEITKKLKISKSIISKSGDAETGNADYFAEDHYAEGHYINRGEGYLGWYPYKGKEQNATYQKINVPFKYTFGGVENGAALERVTSVGFEVWSKSDTVEVAATYKSLIGLPQREGKMSTTFPSDVAPVFFGFKAPEDYYIDSIVIINKGNGTKTETWAEIDELCLITSQVQGPTPVITDIKFTGKEQIMVPSYHTTGTYSYSAKLLDQFGDEMPGEVQIALKEPQNSSYVSFADNQLTLIQNKDLPETITLTAISVDEGSVTKDLVITLKGSPYYNEELIGVKDGNPEYTLSAYKADMEAAGAADDKDWALFNFVSEDFTLAGGMMTMPLEGKQLPISVKRTGANFAVETIPDDGVYYGNKVTATAGNKFLALDPVSSGQNTYTFVTDDIGNFRVTSFGIVILTYNTMTYDEEFGFYIEAFFSDGTSKKYGKDISGGGKPEGNTFYAIKAPEGHYINTIDIETPRKVFSACGELSVIVEEPDILVLDEAYEKFMFSSVTSQDMKNIRENLSLPQSTPEGATIVWESDNDAVIDDQTGVVTLPGRAEDSDITLKAHISYGALTQTKSFKLFVPSTLELDKAALTLPTIVSENISLPSAGANGSAIIWTSDDSNLIEIVGNEGRVKRPSGKDGYVILTATISNKVSQIVKDFPISVSGTIRDETFGSDNDGSGSGSGSGSGGGGGGIGTYVPMTAPVVPEQLPQIEKPETTIFTDLSTNHWAHDSIVKLYEKNIVNGTGNGEFSPEATVTREEFITMLVRALGFKVENKETGFSDIAAGAWYADFVKTAASLGIVSGRDDGSFGIGQSITREDMAVMAYRAMQAANKEISKNENVPFNDAEKISDYAREAISALKGNGIINGISENEFSPKTTTTRAQAGTIICRILGEV